MNATQLTPATPKPALFIPARVAERARTHVIPGPTDGCLISKYSTASHGYAQIGWHEGGERTVTLVHRVVWASANGPIPDGMTVDHICKVRQCVNIAHLRLLSNFENARRTFGRDWELGQCVNGHPNSFLMEFENGKTGCFICATWIWKASPKGILRPDRARRQKRTDRGPRQHKTAEPKQPRPPKTHCRNGHDWVPENFYTRPDGRNECLPCKQTAAKTWHNSNGQAA